MARFGELLRRYRNRAGLTQQQLGDRLRLSSPYIAQIESGLKPPPPSDIVGRTAQILRLAEKEAREFLELARVERGRQSLARATGKLGYVLAGNDVLVSEEAISDCIRRELTEVFKEAGPESARGIFVGGLSKSDTSVPEDGARVLRSRDDMLTWVLDYLGEEADTGLVFLSLLYRDLQLIDSDRMVGRNPTPLRHTIEEERADPGLLLSRLKSVIDKARQEARDNFAPNVIPSSETVAPAAPAVPESAVNRYIPVIGVVEPNSDEIVQRGDLEPVEVPRSWLDDDAEYRAIEVRSDLFEVFGIWPGTTVLFELGGEAETDDIVVVQFGDRLTIMVVKMRMAEEGNLILQGGGRSAPVVYVQREDEARIMGIVRQFMSLFRDMKRRKRQHMQEETR